VLICLFSFDHCIVFPSSIYGFSYLWYLQTCLTDADLRRVIYSNVHVGDSQGTKNKKKLAASFNFTLRSIFDVLSRNNSKFGDLYIGIASITFKLN